MSQRHVTVSLTGMMKQGPDACANMLKREDGTHLTGQEAYDLLWKHYLDGFEVLPVCDNHDAKGHCLGHPITPKKTC